MLYKFRAATEQSFDALSRRMLHAQHFTRFNDPFECGAHFLSGQIDREAEPARFAAMIAAWGFEDLESAPLEGTEEYFEQFETFDLGLSRPGLRICCFASAADNLLMWSHYGDGLRGFCIEFDETLLLGAVSDLSSRPFITDVNYADEPPVVDGMVLGVLDDQIDYAYMCFHSEKDEFWLSEAKRLEGEIENLYKLGFATKPREWSYERERRLIFQTDQHDLAPLEVNFPAEAVRSITVGELMPADDMKQIETIAAATYPLASIRTARRRPSTYKVGI